MKCSLNHSILPPHSLKKTDTIKRKINKPRIKREINTASSGGVNLSFDFSHPPKLLRNRLMPFENAIFGVKNAILGIADLIKPCNQADKPFIKNKPETRLFLEQRVWRREWDSNPRGP
ncbi:MAG: hypothetical protein QXZ70_00340 [Candidatus Bathyarchaeia archaeon]